MPLSHDIDGSQILLALVCGGISGFFHWVATQTSDKEVSWRKLRGDTAASFAAGVIVVWALQVQQWIVVDPLGAFCAAMVVGFAYGPTGMIVAARTVARLGGFTAPETSGVIKGTGGEWLDPHTGLPHGMAPAAPPPVYTPPLPAPPPVQDSSFSFAPNPAPAPEEDGKLPPIPAPVEDEP